MDGHEHALSGRSRVLLVATCCGLFGVALAVRGIFVDGDYYGDEAWYFYLARTLGTEPQVATDHAWFHLVNRPAYYAAFHPAALGGLGSFRIFGSVVAALAPLLCFGAARAWGARVLPSALVASFLCFQRQHLEHGAHGFPDLLATDLALAAIWAAGRGHARTTCALALGCVLSKESFIAVPVLAAWLMVSRDKSLRWASLTIALPVTFVAIVSALGLSMPGVAMQGWAPTPFTLKHARNMWVGPEVWPLLLWLGYRRHWRTLAIWLALPAFYLLWNVALGRGIAPWYAIGPAALSGVAAALALDALWDDTRSLRWQWVPVALASMCLAPVPLAGVMAVAAKLRELDGRMPAPSVAPTAMRVIAQQKPDRVLIVGCFWAYAYSHLRGDKQPAARVQWADVPDVSQLEALARNADLVIVCRSPEHHNQERQLSDRAFDTLAMDDWYWVLRQRRDDP